MVFIDLIFPCIVWFCLTTFAISLVIWGTHTLLKIFLQFAEDSDGLKPSVATCVVAIFGTVIGCAILWKVYLFISAILRSSH